ncbi:hypothetical protein K502DRAFT_345630 [Neoconidiobolus thromboides FSU 785]|nr:hypothetical protein K502DRAFT_345630 [Neoconidiobolus thromboides FSU 785]
MKEKGVKFMFINQYVREVNTLIKKKDWITLSKDYVPVIYTELLLDMNDYESNGVKLTYEEYVKPKITRPFGSFFLKLTQARHALGKGELLEIFEALFESVCELLRLTNLTREHLCLFDPLLKEIKQLAYKLDDDNQSDDKLERYSQLVTRCVGFCSNDRQEVTSSRKWGTYKFVNLLLSFYIKRKQFNLIKSVMRLIATADIDVNLLPKSQVLAYFYYLGVNDFFESKYNEALNYFKKAFELCPGYATECQESILKYLIPLQLNLLNLPKIQLLQKYPNLVKHYHSLVLAVQRGDIQLYEKSLKKNIDYYKSTDCLLLIEKMRIIIIYSLIKKIYSIHDNNSRIPLNTIYKAHHILLKKEENGNNDTSNILLELEISSLIRNEFIRGYVAHDQQILVLSKVEPFPIINSISSDF